MSTRHKDQLRQKIYNELRSTDICKRIKAIQLLPKLNSYEGIQVIEAILKIEGNLGMKLEALRILPQLINPQTYRDVSRILQISIEDHDPEVVRNGLLTIRRIPPDFASKSLVSTVIEILHAQDTDLQYHAIISLLHLRTQIPSEKLCTYILPFTKHPNKVLRDMARKAFHELGSSKNKEV